MAVNKNHPRYPEYAAKCEVLAARQWEEAEAVPYSGGQDGPLEDVYRKYAEELKTLRKEYAYLFTEGDA